MAGFVANRASIKAVSLSLAVLSLCSCGPPIKVHPASGQVFVDGQPAVGALVVLHPIDPSAKVAAKPSGRVDASGSFVLSTFRPRDGAPAGEYRVAIAWLDDASKADPQTGEIPTKARPDYADPATSPLRVRIEVGKNEIPVFQLSK
jgi:hypothetical protein